MDKEKQFQKGRRKSMFTTTSAVSFLLLPFITAQWYPADCSSFGKENKKTPPNKHNKGGMSHGEDLTL